MLVLGLDPGLRRTGWGLVTVSGNRLQHAGHGTIAVSTEGGLAQRLARLHEGICEILERYRPDEAAVEETFVNKNPESTLKLGAARGVVLLAPARQGLPVAEYTPNQVKKAVVGAGHAAKQQVELMVGHLLPGCRATADAADALAVAICHAHLSGTQRRIDLQMAAPR